MAERHQYIVTLSGKGEIELAGGRKIALEPGSVILEEDSSVLTKKANKRSMLVLSYWRKLGMMVSWSARILHKMLPLIQGVIARRMLLNFRADADLVQRLLPAPLQVDQRNGHATWVFA